MREEQQIAPIIHRSAPMLFDQSTAKLCPLTPLIGRHQRYSRATTSSSLGQFNSLLGRYLRGQHTQLTRIGQAVDREGTVVEMQVEILQLNGSSADKTTCHKGIIEHRLIAGQPPLHKDLTHDGIDKGGMDPMPPKITRSGYPLMQHGKPIEASFDIASADAHGYFFNRPARRPVEKAICRL